MNRFVTEVRAKFNPFSPSARPTRLFLAYIPPNARASGMNISTTLLPKTSTESPLLHVKFKDGKEMNLESEKLGINGILEEIDRHCRLLQKQADLSDN